MTQPAPRLQSWAESWWRAIADLGRATHERREVVLQEVQVGSVPTLTYYALLGISELIAGFALIIDSDATLIGANIVAPLMTPIFGIALGLVRGDLRLLRTALVAEFGGLVDKDRGSVTLCRVLVLRRVLFQLYALLKVHLAEEDAYLRILERGVSDDIADAVTAALAHPVAGA